MNVKLTVMGMILIIVAILLVANSLGFDYCQIKTCWQHTACLYKSQKPSYQHNADYNSSGLTNEEKRSIVNLHNQFRRKVATGQETRGNPGPQPKAKYMPDLVWDNELEMIAQLWADQCIWRHDMCRDVERFRVGQNLAAQYYYAHSYPVKVDSLVELWYNEVKYFNSNDVDRFRFSMKIGHYTQLIWANTTHIGCGATRCKEGYFSKFYLVCNYGPTGNYMGKPVYERA